MDRLATSPSLANRRRRPADPGAGMIALRELAANPVAFTVFDADGGHSISAERGQNGKVWLTCQCASSQSDGWCRHRIDLLCFRYDGAKEPTAASRRAFEAIVTGTPVGEAGRDADRAIKAFDVCLRIFDERRPAEVVGRNLGKFTNLISDLAACAGELEDALGNLRRLFERT